MVVCMGYDDYLKQTLPFMLTQVDRLMVVTEEGDLRTKKLCTDLGAAFVVTDKHKAGGAVFNKGRAINAGWHAVKPKDWFLFLDADIVLPTDFRFKLSRCKLDKETFWCVPRKRVPTYAAWKAYLNDPAAVTGFELQTTNLCMGYFQLFHVTAAAVRGRMYPETSKTAAVSDKHFLHNWDRSKRATLENMYVLHLDHGPHSVNWRGRKSERYGE